MTLANKTVTAAGSLEGAGGNRFDSSQYQQDLYDEVAYLAASASVLAPTVAALAEEGALEADGSLEVTGARDDGTALASLLTVLASLGLILDSTTAS